MLDVITISSNDCELLVERTKWNHGKTEKCLCTSPSELPTLEWNDVTHPVCVYELTKGEMHDVKNHNTEKDGLVTNLQVNRDFGAVILLLKGGSTPTDPPL
jgi:hypothetical protein